jgi:hypothetical protein
MFEIGQFESKTLTWWHSQQKSINMSPTYQRKGGIWNNHQKQYLIDTILNGFDIPKLYFADFVRVESPLNEISTKYAVIDGRQRLEAIFDFLEGRLTLPRNINLRNHPNSNVGGMNYNDLKSLHREISYEFDNYNLSVMRVITNEPGLINELFVRLNASMRLTGAELRNAMGGVVPQMIRKLVEHDFFTDRINFNTGRMQEYNVAAKLLLLEAKDDFTDTKKTDLDKLVNEHVGRASNITGLQLIDKMQDISVVVDKVAANLDKMSSVFSTMDPLLKSQGEIPAYYMAIRKMEVRDLRIFRSFLVKFDSDRLANRRSVASNDAGDPVLQRYEIAARTVNDAASIRFRSELLERRFSSFKDGIA